MLIGSFQIVCLFVGRNELQPFFINSPEGVAGGFSGYSVSERSAVLPGAPVSSKPAATASELQGKGLSQPLLPSSV